MKRLSLSFVLILSAALIFSVAGLADEADYAEADVTLTNTFDINATGNPTIEITQDGTTAESNDGITGNEVALSNLGTSSLANFTGDITVTVMALSNYNIAASYFNNSNPTGTAVTSGDLLNLVSGSSGSSPGVPYDLTNFNHSSQFSGGGDWTGTTGDKPSGLDTLTSGSNNMGNTGGPGDTYTYGLELDLAALNAGDYDNGNSLTFQVAFWVYDSTST